MRKPKNCPIPRTLAMPLAGGWFLRLVPTASRPRFFLSGGSMISCNCRKVSGALRRCVFAVLVTFGMGALQIAYAAPPPPRPPDSGGPPPPPPPDGGGPPPPAGGPGAVPFATGVLRALTEPGPPPPYAPRPRPPSDMPPPPGSYGPGGPDPYQPHPPRPPRWRR
jgi:hypothetical protein